MELEFYKYHGTGNDFIIINNLKKNKTLSTRLIKLLCDRHFGIGADGLMTIETAEKKYDFRMKYFNSDGKEGTMCGNGGRCIVSFAKKINLVNNKSKFIAIDGEHIAEIIADDYIKLKMNDVSEIKKYDDGYFLNTGSPHFVKLIKSAENFNVFENGKNYRYDNRFAPEGANVNFIEKKSNNKIFVATYERGVENETLSCGTGITASALIHSLVNNLNSEIEIESKGGLLKVYYQKEDGKFKNIWLQGEAKFVFKGTILI